MNISNIVLIEKGELVDNGYKCIVLNADNTKSEKIIPKAECELLMYLLILEGRLRQQEMTNLKKLIHAYGDEICNQKQEFHRPKTVGDLLESLKKGIKCEVVASHVEITNIKLDGWLKYEGQYITYLSTNIGWVIYEKTK